jgi:hypothetical protein
MPQCAALFDTVHTVDDPKVYPRYRNAYAETSSCAGVGNRESLISERLPCTWTQWPVICRSDETSSPQGKLTTVTGVSGLAIVDDPPVLSITLSIPPNPAVLRKIVSRSFMLAGGRVVGTSDGVVEFLAS